MRRLFFALPIALLLVSVFVLLLPKLTEIDVASATLRARYGDLEPDPAATAALRKELGLDAPLIKQYARFVSKAARGDFGVSFVSSRAVAPSVWSAARASGTLLAITMAVSILGGIALGAVAAARQGMWIDRVATGLSTLASASPEHVLGPILVLLFAVMWRVLPSGGWGSLESKVLPVVVLATFPFSAIVQIVRSEMVEALQMPFIRTAVAKGLSRRRVLRHAFAVSRQGLIATSSVMVAGLLGGAVVVENVFSIPGLGRLILEASRTSDLPMLQAGLLVGVTAAITIGMVADLVAGLCDPRVRRSSK